MALAEVYSLGSQLLGAGTKCHRLLLILVHRRSDSHLTLAPGAPYFARWQVYGTLVILTSCLADRPRILVIASRSAMSSLRI